MDSLTNQTPSTVAKLMYELSCRCRTVYTIVFYEDAVAILKELCKYEDVDINSVEMVSPMFNGYHSEYVVVLTDDCTLFVEPAMDKSQKVYKTYESDVVLVDGNASYHTIADRPYDKCYIIEWA